MQKHETSDSIRLGILLIKEKTTSYKTQRRIIIMARIYRMTEKAWKLGINMKINL